MNDGARDIASEPLTSNRPGVRPQFIIVGGGKMGSAILSGLIDSQSSFAHDLTSDDFLIVNPGADRRQYLTDLYGVQCVADVSGIAESGFIQHVDADAQPSGEDGSSWTGTTDPAVAAQRPLVVIVAVKPQVIQGVLSDMAKLPLFQDQQNAPIFVSIAAGITVQTLTEALPEGACVIRTMPNMPLLVGKGATGVCIDSSSENAQRALSLVVEMFDSLGKAVVVEEEQIDAVCALSGSGPAYVARMIEALVDAAVEQGISEELAQTLALQTVLGTAYLLDQSELSPTELRVSVSSPGGTTLAALDAMEAGGLSDSLHDGVAAAVQRSKELAAGS